MAGQRSNNSLPWIAAGFVLYLAAKRIGIEGDLEPMGTARTSYHLLALAVNLLAIAAFVRGALLAFRAIAGSPPDGVSDVAGAFGNRPVSGRAGEFDPDAAFARYMANKAGSEDEDAVPPQPVRPPTFGHRPL